ncbi:hypothetical protein QWM81_20330 [Streptomyces ficellus]|uniref:Uncharacterized protein n=1 Tax=Streptomyces ficellus TaxID=1977088 RepID=A0ABT7ZA30_9ACTN|nr:hypothetical protein [Streptomyces ficellus]MDN3296368.1 hypothetical protein [Streptomyces ficellus]
MDDDIDPTETEQLPEEGDCADHLPEFWVGRPPEQAQEQPTSGEARGSCDCAALPHRQDSDTGENG